MTKEKKNIQRPFHSSHKIFFGDWLSKGVLERNNTFKEDLNFLDFLPMKSSFSIGLQVFMLFTDLLLLCVFLEC